MSRLLPTDKLAHCIEIDPWDFDPHEEQQFVFLRDRDTKQELEFAKDHPVAAKYQRRLAKINEVNAQFGIFYQPYCEWSKSFGSRRQLRPVHYAVFTDTFDQHGRIYTDRYGHQALRKIERQTIEFEIDPPVLESSVEWDYGSFHPRMAYNLFDEAHSAFHGDHVEKGALGKFLKCIEAKIIPIGSIIWVESVDRLTRQNPMKAMKMVLFGIIERGVGIYVDDLHTLYDADNADDSIGELYGEIKRAYRESKRKSDLANAAWDQRRERVRETRELFSPVLPEWIEVAKDGSRTAKPGAEKTFVQMFQWREQKLGYELITKKLNDVAKWLPSEGWKREYVKKILKDRRVLGEYQMKKGRQPNGDVIPGYFPNLLKKHPGLFESVQRVREKQIGKSSGGRNGKGGNVLQHLCKCAYCDGPMHLHDGGNGNFYLICFDGKRGHGKCKTLKPNPGIPYNICVKAVLYQCRTVRPEQILPKKDEQTKLCQSLRQQIQRKSATLEEKQERIANLDQLLETTTDPKRQARHEQRIIELEAEKGEAEKELANLVRDLQNADRAERTFVEVQQNIESLEKELATDNVEVRHRLNAQLREFIDRIEVFAHGLPPEYDGDDFGDYFYSCIDAIEERNGPIRLSEEQSRFVVWAAAQQRTKAGRFLRVHFKVSNAYKEDKLYDLDWKGYLDVVPEGSIADQPNIDSLWNQFKSTKSRTM